jgi:hypothetical protein
VFGHAPADNARVGSGSLICDAARHVSRGFGPALQSGASVWGFSLGLQSGAASPRGFSCSSVNELRWGARSPGATVAG